MLCFPQVPLFIFTSVFLIELEHKLQSEVLFHLTLHMKQRAIMKVEVSGIIFNFWDKGNMKAALQMTADKYVQ